MIRQRRLAHFGQVLSPTECKEQATSAHTSYSKLETSPKLTKDNSATLKKQPGNPLQAEPLENGKAVVTPSSVVKKPSSQSSMLTPDKSSVPLPTLSTPDSSSQSSMLTPDKSSVPLPTSSTPDFQVLNESYKLMFGWF